MRLRVNEIENLAPVPFVLFAGLIGGVLQSLGEFVHDNAAGTLIVYLIVNGAAVVLWWASVRRRRYSVWATACHITVALGLAQLISFALVMPRAVPANVPLRWLDVSGTALSTQLALSPIRFLGATLLVALGRLLPGSRRGQVGPRVAA